MIFFGGFICGCFFGALEFGFFVECKKGVFESDIEYFWKENALKINIYFCLFFVRFVSILYLIRIFIKWIQCRLDLQGIGM